MPEGSVTAPRSAAVSAAGGRWARIGGASAKHARTTRETTRHGRFAKRDRVKFALLETVLDSGESVEAETLEEDRFIVGYEKKESKRPGV